MGPSIMNSFHRPSSELLRETRAQDLEVIHIIAFQRLPTVGNGCQGKIDLLVLAVLGRAAIG